MTYNVYGGKVLVIGDLHFSDVYTGKHKNYLSNCMKVLAKLSNIIEKENPSAVVLLGDLVGWIESNIKNREMLSFFCKTIRSWGNFGSRPVFAVRGNHDLRGFPDFMFLVELDAIITSQKCEGYFDYYPYKGATRQEIRFHIVDYNDESRHLDIVEGDVSNIVLGHNNYTINGLTTWYSEHNGIELGMLQNFSGVDMVISGHIHEPSPELIGATMPNGKTCSLLYAGCPTRPVKTKNPYNSCHIVKIEYSEELGSTNVDTIPFDLEPWDDIFYQDESFIEDSAAAEDVERKEALKDVLGDILKYRMNQCDPITQIQNIPNASEEAKQVAISYMSVALNNSEG